MREALSKLIANMVYLGATEEEIMKVIRMSKELIDCEKKYGDHVAMITAINEYEQITTAHN